jgi:L-ribulose-5-phosphate 4-epimerase
MLEELKARIWQANLDLVKYELVVLTFGNVSGFDRGTGFMVIKPSGVSYESIRPEDMAVMDLKGKIIEGHLNPSSDAPTHRVLYRAFEGIGGICHAHSDYASAFAQAGQPIPCLGTTHADQFNGPVPVARLLKQKEVRSDYETNTGKIIVERFARMNPLEMPAVLVPWHGPFTWGKSPEEAVKNAIVLEKIAKMAILTRLVSAKAKNMPGYLLRKHHQRKHGPKAYYGQLRSHEE